jgi:hypothetical protein
LQELLAASKLREAEASLALKDLRSKLGELNTMWQKHLKRADTSPKVGTMEELGAILRMWLLPCLAC